MEATTLSEARVYVGTYAKYNNGSLYGDVYKRQEVAGLLRLFLPYVGDVLRCYAALEELVAYLVASRTVGKTNGKVGFAASQIAHLPAFSFCQDVYKRQE